MKSEVLIIIAWGGTRTSDHGVRLVHRTICLHHQHLAMEMLSIVLSYDFKDTTKTLQVPTKSFRVFWERKSTQRRILGVAVFEICINH